MTIIIGRQVDDTTEFAAFLPEVLPYVHDCPQVVAVNAIRNAAIEFCEKSHYWQVNIEPMNMVAGENTYEVPVPDDTVLIDVKGGWYNGRLVIPKSPEELSRLYRNADWRTVIGGPTYITRITGSEVIVVPNPDRTEEKALALRAIIAPSRAATTITTDVYEQFLEAIAMGAKARLYETPGQPYYDIQLAAMCKRLFMVAIGEAKIKANKGYSRASVAIEFPGFA